MLRVSVVEVALIGLCRVASVVVVELWEDGPLFSSTVVQAERDTNRTAAIVGMINFFIFDFGADAYLSLSVVVVVVVFFSSTIGGAGATSVDGATTVVFLTMTLEATIWSPALV